MLIALVNVLKDILAQLEIIAENTTRTPTPDPDPDPESGT